MRTGLWLGNITLDETIEDVMPKFHIKDRIGAKDRCLFVYELENDNQQGIQFIGANSPGFHFTPSCFSLRVNNIYFFNYSFDFLFSKNIGFPYSKTLASSNREDRGYLAKLEKGTEVISKPLINFKFLKASTYIYQPIIPKLLIEDADQSEDVYDTEYVKNNCLDYEKRKGDIFYFDRDLFKLTANEELQLTTGLQKLSLETFPRLIAKQTLKTLELVNQIKPELELLTSEQKDIVLKNRSYILKMHRDFMSGLL